jgi:hypothetical protein
MLPAGTSPSLTLPNDATSTRDQPAARIARRAGMRGRPSGPCFPPRPVRLLRRRVTLRGDVVGVVDSAPRACASGSTTRSATSDYPRSPTTSGRTASACSAAHHSNTCDPFLFGQVGSCSRGGPIDLLGSTAAGGGLWLPTCCALIRELQPTASSTTASPATATSTPPSSSSRRRPRPDRGRPASR